MTLDQYNLIIDLATFALVAYLVSRKLRRRRWSRFDQ